MKGNRGYEGRQSKGPFDAEKKVYKNSDEFSETGDGRGKNKIGEGGRLEVGKSNEGIVEERMVGLGKKLIDGEGDTTIKELAGCLQIAEVRDRKGITEVVIKGERIQVESDVHGLQQEPTNVTCGGINSYKSETLGLQKESTDDNIGFKPVE